MRHTPPPTCLRRSTCRKGQSQNTSPFPTPRQLAMLPPIIGTLNRGRFMAHNGRSHLRVSEQARNLENPEVGQGFGRQRSAKSHSTSMRVECNNRDRATAQAAAS